jgi:hypothetical protein
MKVRELLAKLQTVDPDLEVVGYAEDPEVVPAKHHFRLFSVTDVSPMEGVTKRTAEGIPTITFGKDEQSVRLLALDITSKF